MKTIIILAISLCLISPFSKVLAFDSVKQLRVFKNEHRLELLGKDNQIIKTYKIMLGRNPVGAKKFEGDNKTPEGTYTLDIKGDDSKFHKSFHISYPNNLDIFKARLQGRAPGGDIMLHGYPEDFNEMKDWLKMVNLDSSSDEVIRAGLGNYDWTNGCIAVTDSEIDEIYSLVDVPTKILINP
jgi:murein L,D-transpeptidase YafK